MPGYLEAVAYKGGRRVASHRIETTGMAKALTLSADKTSWKADGQDLMHVRVEAVDSKGRKVPSAQARLQFEVQGNARIVAVDNGDMRSDELHVANTRSLYHGSALVILRAGKTPGKVTLTVKGDGFRSKKITLSLSAD